MEERHWWFLGKRHIIKTLLAALPASGERDLVVDVGCGPGGNVGALADSYDVAGIDTLSSDLQATSSGASSSSFSDATVPAERWLNFNASAVSGSPNKLWVAIEYIID